MHHCADGRHVQRYALADTGALADKLQLKLTRKYAETCEETHDDSETDRHTFVETDRRLRERRQQLSYSFVLRLTEQKEEIRNNTTRLVFRWSLSADYAWQKIVFEGNTCETTTIGPSQSLQCLVCHPKYFQHLPLEKSQIYLLPLFIYCRFIAYINHLSAENIEHVEKVISPVR